MDTVRTTCPYCGVGCGILATSQPDGTVQIQGDPEHPANEGRLCSKGAALGETLDLDGRLLHPHVDGVQTDWDAALTTTARRLQNIIDQHGPDAVAFYVSGQLLTEDYYVANKLMKGFIGSANIDTNSRLCMSSAVAGHKRAFGADSVPCSYSDLEQAELIILVGSNAAWCHPVLYQRMVTAKQANPALQLVVIDPRRTATCDVADLHLAIAPGTDQLLFNGLLAYLEQQGLRDTRFVEQHTEGVNEALAAAQQQGDLLAIAERCGLSSAHLEQFYRLFAANARTVTLFSQGINQWSCGTDRVNAIINCHLLTGRIGRAGMGPFSITGQPNAMGGREVGGLANQLAAHMTLDNEQHRQLVEEFWQAPRLAQREGLKAVDLFEAIETGHIKAIWIMATNPAVSLPDAHWVRRTLAGCELVIVSDCMQQTDTTAYADILLPAATWGERDGSVTNSERRISRQRAFLPLPGEARPDWWIITRVAQQLGYVDAFAYQHPQQIFCEHAALSGYLNRGERDFDISALQDLSTSDYESLSPVQWPVNRQAPQGTMRLFGDGRFYTPSGRACLVAVEDHQPANLSDADYPLILNSGRSRDQWHSMTRTGKSARLSGHRYEPVVEIHPQDARRYNVVDGELVRVSNQRGEVIVRARVDDRQRCGSVFIPLHWNDQFASRACVDTLVNRSVDPISGQPEFKHTPVHIEIWQPVWHGFMLSRRKLDLTGVAYWSRARGNGLWRYELADQTTPDCWSQQARDRLCAPPANAEWVEYQDQAARRYRAARIEQGQLESCLFIGPDRHLPQREWLARLFSEVQLSLADRAALLSGRPADPRQDCGQTVCACFGIGRNTLLRVIGDQQLESVEQIGASLKAGTNCGSCLPELKQLLLEASAHPS